MRVNDHGPKCCEIDKMNDVCSNESMSGDDNTNAVTENL